jgi:hypothetical protein
MNNASSSGFISLDKAIEMTTRYRKNRNVVINPTYAGQDILALSDRFDAKVFATLLAKPGCAYIRIYYGMEEDLKIRPLVVAVDENDKDILTSDTNLDAEGEDVGDDSLRCPPLCPPPSPLNQP